MGFLQTRRARSVRLKVRGLVLAGGKSSRFGEDKASVFYKGKRFIEHAADLLESIGLKPVVVTRQGADYPFLRCPVLRDKLPEKGPLGGIYTAMSVFKNISFLVLTCDMPALHSSALLKLLTHQSTQHAIVFSYNSALQPFPGIYSSSLFVPIGRRIIKGNLSMTGLLEETDDKTVLSWRSDGSIFLNINRKEDIFPTAAPVESNS